MSPIARDVTDNINVSLRSLEVSSIPKLGEVVSMHFFVASAGNVTFVRTSVCL